MPILQVEIVDNPGATLASGLAQRLADEAGRVLGAAPGTTWVTVNLVPSTRYAESGGDSLPGYRPIFVRVLKRALPEGPARASEITALTDAIAGVCGWPAGQVHVIYEPPALGRVAFGGAIVE
jgi:phenylpyruvate tautomerase PptA (4-oxalocrotonate tautomerase family)